MEVAEKVGAMGYIAYSPDGALMTRAQNNGELLIWDSNTGELLFTLSDFGEELLNYPHDRGLRGLDFCPLCNTSSGGVCQLATVGTDGQAIIWDANTGEQILKYQNEEALTAVAFSPDGKLLAFGNAQWANLQQGGVVKLLDVESGEILYEWSGIAGWVFSLAFSPDGKHLALGTTFGDFRIMDVETGEQIHKPDATNVVLNIAYTPDGKKIITTTFDYLTTIWDAKTGERLYVLAESTALPIGLSISPDGSMVAVGMDMIYTYILDVGQLAALGGERLTRNFALDECQKYLHLEHCPEE
jgi:WD40 repeat protein